MPFELKVALRYLWSSRLQTGLILSGVGVGIVAYTFMAALINGLAVSLTDDVIGNIAHVTLEPAERRPQRVGSWPDTEVLWAEQRAAEIRPKIEGWRPLLADLEALPEVTAVAPQVEGNGFFQRGSKVLPVGINGLVAGRESEIVDLASGLLEGDLRLGPGDVLIGVGLADELGVGIGQRLRIESERDRERSLRISGIFDVGSSNVNSRLVFVDLRTAQSLLELEGAVTGIALKIRDIYSAPALARRLGASTGLLAKDWIGENERLQQALRAQGTTGDLIKLFSLLTIVIGVASVLLLAAVRRRQEIGIMRGMGISRGSVRQIFQLQGFFIGLLGSSAGALGGWLFCQALLALTTRPDGSAALPVDPALGEYGTAILLATTASTLSAILPARAAARVDPLEVIQS